MTRPVVLGAAFLVTLGVVLGGAAAGGVLVDSGVEDPPAIENEQYRSDGLVKDRTPGTADVTMDADADPQTVVVDPGLEPESGPRPPRAFLFGFGGPETAERDILPLVNALAANGHEVRIFTPPEESNAGPRPAPPGASEESLTPLGKELAEADAFVTFRTDYSDDQLDAIETFVEADGRILVATDPAATFERPGGSGLKSTLNVTTHPGYVYNMKDNDLNFQRIFARPTGDSPLTEGVDRVVFATASPVGASTTTDALVPTDGARLSTSRAATDAPVLVRSGGVVLVGDTNFLWPENAQRADNDALIGNLADFLVTNDRTPSEQPPRLPEPPGNETERPAGPPLPGGPGGPDQNATGTPPRPTPGGAQVSSGVSPSETLLDG